MEAKCKKCEKWFDRHKIFVSTEGLYCKECIPEDADPSPFSFTFSWKGINALMDYIDGERDLEILEVIEIMRIAMGRKIIAKIRSLLDGEIRESDS